MSLRGLYNDNSGKRDQRHYAEKVNDNVLYTSLTRGTSTVQYSYYDFLQRTVTFLVSGSQSDRVMTFAELDPEVLKLHRDILVELGGHPQPLPLEGPGKPRLQQPNP